MRKDEIDDKTLSGRDTDFVRERITQLRIEKGGSERAMSYALGHSSSYIKHITSGRSFPTLASFLDICEYLRVTPAEFFDPDVSSLKVGHEILGKLTELTEGDLKGFYRIIKNMRPEQYRAVTEILELYRAEKERK